MASTKTLPTDGVSSPEIRFICPAANKKDVIRALKKSNIPFTLEAGNRAEEDTVPWREAFPGGASAVAGLILAGQRRKKSMTQSALSEAAGVPQRHISEMENGKRPIGRVNARKFAKALNVDYRMFL